MKITHNSHVLAVPDADKTAEFFIQKLGFKSQMVIPEQWHFVVRDDCRIMMGSCPDQTHPSELGDHSYFAYLTVDDVDAFYDELQSRGLETQPPETKPWGMREIAVRTPDGHRLTFGQEV